MNRRTLRFGMLIGMVGGAAMAMGSMIVFAVTGRGFWMPVNLIAHTVWHGAPLNGAFSVPALLLGMTVHLSISMMIGIVMAVLIAYEEFHGLMVFVVALCLGMGAWVVQTFVWPAIDPTASAAFSPWIFAVAHALFSAGAAMALLRFEHARTRSSSLDQNVSTDLGPQLVSTSRW